MSLDSHASHNRCVSFRPAVIDRTCNTRYRAASYPYPGGTSTRWNALASPGAPVATGPPGVPLHRSVPVLRTTAISPSSPPSERLPRASRRCRAVFDAPAVGLSDYIASVG
jgi:hypothetical protein